MRKLAIVLAILHIFVMSFAAIPSVSASGFGPCSDDRYDVRPNMGHDKIEQKVKALIRCAEERWSVYGGVAKAYAVAECESGFWPWAVGGDNLGVYQHKDDYWIQRVNSFLKARWFNDNQWDRLHTIPNGAFMARANVIIAMKMVHNSGWGPWSCA